MAQDDGPGIKDSRSGMASSAFTADSATPARLGMNPSGCRPESALILIVDDDEVIARMGRDILLHLGYNAEVTLDAIEALRRFRMHRRDYHLLIADYGLPRMNGLQLAERVQSLCPGLPVILMSGYDCAVSPETRDRCGISAILQKPFTIEEVRKAVNCSLGTWAPPDQC